MTGEAGMGEASRRKKELSMWLAGLSPDEHAIFDAAMDTYQGFIRPAEASGMCYRMCFFLTEYLADRKNLSVDPVVGFTNDGEGDIMASHAWIEFLGKKTDISLTITEHAAVPTGSLLILDRPLSTGRAHYSYHRERGSAALVALAKLESDPVYGGVVAQKEAEHQRMAAIASDSAMRRSYLDAAPDGMTFECLAALVDEQSSSLEGPRSLDAGEQAVARLRFRRQ